jgi:REP element-mobilizing transposase RayT
MLPKRKRPAHGVLRPSSKPVIVFDTFCAHKRAPYLANDECHQILLEVWQEASAWIVGRYVVMPDHIHLFAAPASEEVEYESWVSYWRRQFSLQYKSAGHRMQTNHWDRRLRNGESYQEKWEYVRNNPVRAGLVPSPEEWPYQGEINVLPWK